MKIEEIYKNLKKDGLEVYMPSQKQGECRKEYVVIKDNGSMQHGTFTTNDDLYSIMCFVPKDKYSSLGNLIDRVQESMKKLYPMIKPTNERTPSFYDDTYKAHMISIGYKNYVKR